MRKHVQNFFSKEKGQKKIKFILKPVLVLVCMYVLLIYYNCNHNVLQMTAILVHQVFICQSLLRAISMAVTFFVRAYGTIFVLNKKYIFLQFVGCFFFKWTPLNLASDADIL